MHRPTVGDLEILSLLWECGPVSLSEAHEQLPGDLAYTTVQTRLNRLTDKGLAKREKLGKQPTKYNVSESSEISKPLSSHSSRL